LIKSNEYEKHNNVLVFRMGLTKTIYSLLKNNKIEGAIEVNIIGIRGVSYDEITLSKRYQEGKGLLKTLLPFINNDQDRDIISGSEHTQDSVAVWYKMMKDPSYVNAKESKIINEKGEELPKEKNKIWGPSDKFKDKRVVITF
jgi:hypothetical protein